MKHDGIVSIAKKMIWLGEELERAFYKADQIEGTKFRGYKIVATELAEIPDTIIVELSSCFDEFYGNGLVHSRLAEVKALKDEELTLKFIDSLDEYKGITYA